MFKKLLLALLFIGSASANEVELIVPYPPGGPADNTARIIQRGFIDHGIAMVVVNKPGAQGIIGTNYAAEAKPDGRTLLLGASGANFFAVLNKSEGVKYTEKSFDPVILIGSTPSVLLVNTNRIQSRDFKSLVKEVRNDPALARVGVTTETTKFAANWLFSMARTRVDPIPYNGSAPALKDIVGGHIPMLMDISCPSLNTLRGNSLVHPVIIAAPESVQSIDTYPGFVVSSWFGLYAPAGTPDAVTRNYNRIANRILKTPEYRNQFESCYMRIAGGSEQDFKEFVQNEHKKINLMR